ncbi:DGQHR domain-containing protein [Paenibacillus sp. NPDC101420]|uniref:DGQHR domain-containing protein n=1 Tax=Paenibacillus sp. NPDC101420 TaxID=3390602 RepID=UPI003CFC845B
MAKRGKIKAVVYFWNTKNCFTGFMSYNEVGKYVNIVKDQSMNRLINDASVDLIIKYMKNEGEEIFFPPVIMNCSNKIKYDSVNSLMEIEESSLTIIDGQHRIKAINEILADTEFLSEFGSKKIPFLIIEELSPELHRKLFHTINDKSTKVQNNVSDRFSTTTSNLIGLKYVSDHLDIKEIIEWEGKQSKEKIVYSHMLNCIEIIEDFLQKKFKNTLSTIEGVLVDNKKHLYKNDNYYSVFRAFWDYIFLKLKEKPTDKNFYVKEITLSYISKILINKLDTEGVNDDIEALINIKDKISIILNNFLPKELVFDYVFRINKSSECNESLKRYLDCNKYLVENGITLQNKITFNKLLSKVIPKGFLDNGGYFSVDATKYEPFSAFLQLTNNLLTDLLAQNKTEKEIIKQLVPVDKTNQFGTTEPDEQAAAEEINVDLRASIGTQEIMQEQDPQEDKPEKPEE